MNSHTLSERVAMSAQIVRRRLGAGHTLEGYREALLRRLTAQHLSIASDVGTNRKGSFFERDTLLDLVVESCLLVELRTLPRLEPIHDQQMYTYLEISGLSRGLLINFTPACPRKGIRRYSREEPQPIVGRTPKLSELQVPPVSGVSCGERSC